MVIKLLISAFCNAALAAGLYVAEKKTSYKKLSYSARQIITGVLFGIIAIYSSTSAGGVDIGGAIMNVRDASPLCAGLIFGGPSGIIAGVIGGSFRYFAVYLGMAGAYTQIACALSTVMVGFIAAALRKFMFDDKKPTWSYGVGIAMICEILHMLMIFVTNMEDVATAFSFVKKCTLPMVLGNGVAVGAALILVSLMKKEGRRRNKSQKQISQTFQCWLLVCIVIAFVATNIFSSFLQTKMSEIQTESIIQTNIEDVHQDVLDASDESLLNKVTQIREEYLRGESVTKLAEKYNVIEVNIIDSKGIIVDTNNEEYLGYVMESGEQSAEFMVLLKGDKKEYIQDYRPTSYDNKTYRKYGALTLPDGGFIQVGYDASQFGEDIEIFVGKVAKNRHIGNKGFIVICDEKLNIVTKNSENYGKNIKTTGIGADIENAVSGEVFEVDVKGEPHLCTFSFVEGYYVIGVMPVSEAMYMKNLSLYINVFMGIIIFSVLFILIYFLIKRVVIDNIRKINQTLSQITSGNLNLTVDVRTNEEFASLSDDINSTVSTLKDYIAQAAARIDQELEYAKEIQLSAMPSVFPPYPERRDFMIYALMRAAKEVGGDFYDFYLIGDNQLAFLIADVSGKGIPAAMFMMKAKTIIKDLTESGLEPDEVFTRANEKLCENNDAGMFVTCWFGILNLSTGDLKFANAGHNPPIVCRNNGEIEYIKARSGLVLAGMEGIKYRKNEMKLEAGDRIYLYTDGVTEATNSDSELYGEERLKNMISAAGETEPEKLCAYIEEDVDAFVGETPQFDDITMLAIAYNGNGKIEMRTIELEPKLESVALAVDFVSNLMAERQIEQKLISKVSVAVDEVASNIARYSGASKMRVDMGICEEKVVIRFLDDGNPYNPTSQKEPDVTLSASERQEGGLGIFMVKKMMDVLEYQYVDGQNVLTIEKNL